MTYFPGHSNFVNMIPVIVFIVFVFLETPTTAATAAARKLSMLAEAGGADELELMKWHGYGEDKLSTVEVSGKLFCHGGSDEPNPISGGKVAVLCGSTPDKKISWAKGRTDDSGRFLIDLPSHLHAIPNLEKVCHVRVVHLPKSSPCWQSRCTRKHRQVIKLASIGDGTRRYTADNINLVPDF